MPRLKFRLRRVPRAKKFKNHCAGGTNIKLSTIDHQPLVSVIKVFVTS